MDKSPIQYYDGSTWRYSQFYEKSRKSKGIFVGGGPSLNKIDTSKLCGPGKTVIGVNNTYPQVRPDIWVGMDAPECYNRHVFHEGFPKIMRGGYQHRTVDGVELKDLSNTHFASFRKIAYKEKGEIFRHVGPDTQKFVWQKNVFTTSMNLMIYMGFKEIYLAGVDFHSKNGDYAHGGVLTEDQRDWNTNLYDYLDFYLKWLASTSEMAGIKFYSISPDSPINKHIPYVSIEDVNASIVLPDLGDLVHSSET